MTRIILSGCNGKMGKNIINSVEDNEQYKIVAGVDILSNCGYDFPVFDDFSKVNVSADVIVDFSNPIVLDSLLKFAKENKMPCVLCTTGYAQKQVEQIKEASTEIAVFYSGNMSLGINLLIELSRKATAVFGNDFDIEIVEKHHNQKIDAPSGTALMIADAISDVKNPKPQYVYDRHAYRKKRENNEIGIHAVRGGTIVGEHEVIFAGNAEVLTITHQAQSKGLFAQGAVNAAGYISGKSPGMYDMSDLLASK